MAKQQTLWARKKPTRSSKERILILCEGEVTEPKYFNHLRHLYRAQWVVGSANTKTSPQDIFKIAKTKTKEYDKVYCVFDLENNEARRKQYQIFAETLKIKLYPSNPCFEIWFLLHFGFMEAPYPDGASVKKAVQKLKGMEGYNGKNVNHALLFERLGDALKNAHKLEQCGHDNPATAIHRLIDLLGITA